MRLHRYILLSTIWALLGPVGPARAQTCTFDAQGRLTLVRYTSTQTVTYAYDAAGNITNSIQTGTMTEPDSETDGLPDAWELVHFTSLTNTAAGDFNQDTISNLKHYQDGTDPTDPDTDHDGMPNWAENLAGTSPTNPSSCLRLVSGPVTNSQGLLVCWQSVSGKHYAVERSTNLVLGFLDVVRSNILATIPTNSLCDTNAIRQAPYFYRIRLE
jgi:YD repeat-containing protein